MNLPAIFLPAGPMLRGDWRGETLGSGSDVWKYWAELRAGTITERDWCEIEQGIARSPGHCMTMGTASTMTSAAEALGLTLPGAASIPAADSRHARHGRARPARASSRWCGRICRPSDLLTARVVSATRSRPCWRSADRPTRSFISSRWRGAPASRSTSTRSTRIARRTPLLANIRPSGQYLMEDFFYAGGLRALLASLGDSIDRGAGTANGRTLGENIAGAADVQRRRHPHARDARSSRRTRWRCCAATSRRMAPSSSRRPPSRACTGIAAARRVCRLQTTWRRASTTPDCRWTSDSVLVLKHAGPIGAPGMPEWGQLPIPKKLLEQGRPRHGADLRRAHERHELRRLRAARRAGVVRRRPARARPGRRRDRARRPGAPAHAARRR